MKLLFATAFCLLLPLRFSTSRFDALVSPCLLVVRFVPFLCLCFAPSPLLLSFFFLGQGLSMDFPTDLAPMGVGVPIFVRRPANSESNPSFVISFSCRCRGWGQTHMHPRLREPSPCMSHGLLRSLTLWHCNAPKIL